MGIGTIGTVEIESFWTAARRNGLIDPRSSAAADESWATHFFAELAVAGWGLWFPTLGATTKTRQGWGTHFFC
jgi:hypothetical protein